MRDSKFRSSKSQMNADMIRNSENFKRRGNESEPANHASIKPEITNYLYLLYIRIIDIRYIMSSRISVGNLLQRTILLAKSPSHIH